MVSKDATYRKLYATWIKKWTMECAVKGLSKSKAKEEIDFQLSKETLRLGASARAKYTIKETLRLQGVTIYGLEETYYCERFLCHERTNIMACMDREPPNVGRMVCPKHLEELKREYVAQNKPTLEERENLQSMKKLEESEARWWFEEEVTKKLSSKPTNHGKGRRKTRRNS
ncbi:MAG: hypothetical protein ABSG57_04800 [Candidatus Bathyarchaeia archaeon]|jgi:hypothetical protein